MSAKHTPGPWIVGDDLSGLYIETDSDTIGWVCDVDQIGPDEFERGATTEANARLIAAAPTMYEYIASSASNGCAEARKIMEAINASR